MNPVLLVPGFCSEISTFSKLSSNLTRLPRSVYIPSLIPNTGEVELECLAKQLDNFIDKKFSLTQKLDVVAFSMGGLISRYYIQRLGGIKRVQRLVTISTPHYGTWTSCLCNRPACIQLRPKSQFLQQLNSDISLLKKINFTSIWSPFDFIILPAQSSLIPVGDNISVPVFLHSSIVKDNNIIQEISHAINKPINSIKADLDKIKHKAIF